MYYQLVSRMSSINSTSPGNSAIVTFFGVVSENVTLQQLVLSDLQIGVLERSQLIVAHRATLAPNLDWHIVIASQQKRPKNVTLRHGTNTVIFE